MFHGSRHQVSTKSARSRHPDLQNNHVNLVEDRSKHIPTFNLLYAFFNHPTSASIGTVLSIKPMRVSIA